MKKIIQDFAKNKPNFVISCEPGNTISTYMPVGDAIFINVREIAKKFKEISAELMPFLLEYAIAEEVSHAFIERISPTNYETNTPEGIAKAIFYIAKKEALVAQLVERYLLFQGYPEKLVKFFQKKCEETAKKLSPKNLEEGNKFENLSDLAHFLKYQFNYDWESVKKIIPNHVNEIYGKNEERIYKKILRKIDEIFPT